MNMSLAPNTNPSIQDKMVQYSAAKALTVRSALVRAFWVGVFNGLTRQKSPRRGPGASVPCRSPLSSICSSRLVRGLRHF